MSEKPWKPRPQDAARVAQVMPRVLWIRMRDYARKVFDGGYALTASGRGHFATDVRAYAHDLDQMAAQMHRWADELESKVSP